MHSEGVIKMNFKCMFGQHHWEKVEEYECIVIGGGGGIEGIFNMIEKEFTGKVPTEKTVVFSCHKCSKLKTITFDCYHNKVSDRMYKNYDVYLETNSPIENYKTSN
jgi:hypothetical protein